MNNQFRRTNSHRQTTEVALTKYYESLNLYSNMIDGKLKLFKNKYQRDELIKIKHQIQIMTKILSYIENNQITFENFAYKSGVSYYRLFKVFDFSNNINFSVDEELKILNYISA